MKETTEYTEHTERGKCWDKEVHYASGQRFSLVNRRSITLLDTPNVRETGFAQFSCRSMKGALKLPGSIRRP